MEVGNNDFRSPLSRAKGLGSSGDGTHHWWVQRMTAVILAPLGLWFVYSVVSLIALSRDNGDAVSDWFASPFNAILIAIMLGTMFYHARLGLQVVIEDYVHSHGTKIAMLIGINIIFLIAAIVSISSVATLHFAT